MATPQTFEQLRKCCTEGGGSCSKYGMSQANCTDTILRYDCLGKDTTGAVVGRARLEAPECQAWCKKSPGRCDAEVKKFCGWFGAKQPFCSCLNWKAASILPAKCIDRDCINKGYLTYELSREECPGLNCDIKDKLAAAGIPLPPTEKACTTYWSDIRRPQTVPWGDIKRPPVPWGAVSTPPVPWAEVSKPTTTASPTNNYSYLVYFFVFLVIVVAGIVLVAYFPRNDDPYSSRE